MYYLIGTVDEELNMSKTLPWIWAKHEEEALSIARFWHLSAVERFKLSQEQFRMEVVESSEYLGPTKMPRLPGLTPILLSKKSAKCLMDALARPAMQTNMGTPCKEITDEEFMKLQGHPPAERLPPMKKLSEDSTNVV